MKQYKIFHPFILSFFSKSLYHDVARNWKGIGFLYLLLLVTNVSIIVTAQFHKALKGVHEDEDMKSFIEQVPDITLKNGRISINKPQPYIINDPSQDDNPFIIIDTTGNYTSLEGTNARVLITGSKIYTQDRIYDLSDLSEIGEFTVTRNGVSRVIKIFSNWFAFILFPFIVIFIFLFRIVHILIFALIGILISKIIKVNLIFEQLMRLSAISITPVILANIILSFFNFKIPFWFRLGISLGYLFYAIKVNAQTDLSQEQSSGSVS